MPARVAMLVLNACDSDARVLREAATLRAAGYEVRVFAFSNREWPPGVFDVHGTTVHRLPVAVGYTSALRVLTRLARRRSVRPAATPTPSLPRTPQARPRSGGATALAALRRFLRGRAYALHRPYTVLGYWKSALRAVPAYRPDVVHAHDLNTLPVAARIAARAGAALVYDSHELWRRRNRHGERRPVARLVEALSERRYLPRADAIITVSEGVAGWLRRAYAPRRPITVVRNLPVARVGASDASLAELAGAVGRRLLLYTGRAMRGRGLELAVDALPDLPGDVDLVLLGYGDRAYVATLADRARRLGVADRVHTVPAVAPDEVPRLAVEAAAALVAIEPVCESYRYALPNKLFEAIQAGVPVVATDLPDIAGVVRSLGVGELFAVGDAEGFRAAVGKVLADPAPYRAAALDAAGDLTWEREQQRLLDVYAGLPVTPRPAS